MTHKLKVSINRWTVDFGVKCESPEGSDCRLVCPEGCESWTVQRDEDGPYHVPFELEEDGNTFKRHRMVDSGKCNTALWLNDDPSLIPELYDGNEFVIGEHEITPVWSGPDEGYLWKEKS